MVTNDDHYHYGSTMVVVKSSTIVNHGGQFTGNEQRMNSGKINMTTTHMGFAVHSIFYVTNPNPPSANGKSNPPIILIPLLKYMTTDCIKSLN